MYQMSDMTPQVDELLTDLVRIAERWPEAQFGLYLHGSHARGEQHRGSDVDVIALARRSTPDRMIKAFLSAGRSSPAASVNELDLKAMTLDRFTSDPWVKLRAARFIGGYDWRTQLPEATFDQQAREALGVLRVVIAENDLSYTDTAGVRKILTWMLSIVAGHTASIAPAGVTEARDLLKEAPHPLGHNIAAALDDLDTAQPGDISSLRSTAIDLQSRVVDFLAEQDHMGHLGPRCHEIVQQIIGLDNRE